MSDSPEPPRPPDSPEAEGRDTMKMKAILVLAAAVAFALAPAVTQPFSGFEADQLPIPQIDPPVQPAGYAFAIWGVIYVWLVVMAGFGLFARDTDPGWDATRTPIIVSLAVGAPWLAVANTSAIWATILIFVMLAGAAWALLRAPRKDRWWLQAPVALYAGWLTAASWVSLATIGAGYGVLFGQIGWAVVGLLGALTTSFAIMRLRPGAPEYAVAVVWALVGVAVANIPGAILIAGIAGLGAVGVAWLALQSVAGRA